MADKKITQLTNITGVNLVDADEFVVVDISADETKAVTLGELKEAFDSGSGFVRITGDTMTGDLGFGDNDKAIFGAELEIYSDETHARIREYGSGQLKIQGDNMQLLTSDGASTYLEGNASTSAVTLYHASNAPKLATTSTGIDVTGTVTADGLNVEIADNDAGPVTIQQGGNSYFKIVTTNSSESVQLGNSTTNPDILLGGGNVGIGTSSPSVELSIAGSDPQLVLWEGVDGASSSKVQLGTGTAQGFINVHKGDGARTVQINSDGDSYFNGGNVGIGATSISGVLTLQKNQAASATAGTGTTLTLNGDANAGNPWEIFRDNGVTGDLVFSQDASGTRSEYMRISSAGSVGIGTSSPATKLHIAGSSSVRNTIVSNVTLDGGVSVVNPYDGFGFGIDFIGRDYGNAVRNYAGIYTEMESQSSSAGGGDAGFTTGLSFYTNAGGASDTDPVERLRIDSSGRVGINTSSIDNMVNIQESVLAGRGASNGNTSLTLEHATDTGIQFFSATQTQLRFGDAASTGAGSIIYEHGDDSLRVSTNGSEAMRIDSSGNVGIGTSSPTALIDISKSGTADYSTFRLSNTGASGRKYEIGLGGNAAASDYANKLYFRDSTAGANRITLDSSGNVGIGTSSPAAKLNVNGNGRFDNSAATPVRLHINNSGSNDYASIYADTTSAYKNLILNPNGGNVGIGTTSPNAITNYTGLTLNNGTYGGFIDIENNGTHTFRIISNTTATYIRTIQADPLVFDTNDTERMRIDSSGNLLVGKTSSDYATEGVEIRDNEVLITKAGANPLSVRNNGAGGLISFNSAGSAVGSIKSRNSESLMIGSDFGTDAYICLSNDNVFPVTSTGAVKDGATNLGVSTGRWQNLYLSRTLYVNATSVQRMIETTSFNTTSQYHHAFQNNSGTLVGNILVSTSATSFNTSSDYRLKTDVQPMTGASARVQELNPVNFEWLVDGTRVDGFLAHEAATVVPEAVTGTKDAMSDEEYEVTPAVLDDDGNVVTEAVMGTRSVPDYQSIDQSKLVPLLTAALQEALTEITALKARVTALEG